MPEGDTLRRAAETLTPVLEGRRLDDVWFRRLRGHRPRPGDIVTAVEAVGKYLVISFDRGLALHTHLGMAGSWRTSTLGASIPRDPRLRIVLTTDAGRALCFAAPSISTHVIGRDVTPLDRLGPDLSDDDTDLAEVLRRSRLLASGTTAAEMLLDQKVGAGVGNVFKSEALFVAGIHPFRTVQELSDDELERVWSVAHRQLVVNRSTPYRSTTGPGRDGRTHVYGRHRFGCRRCDNAVSFSAAGERTQRSTYWCPTCQPTSA